MKRKKLIRVVTLKDMWSLLLRRLWVMILAAVICAGSAYAYVTLTYQPKYRSTAILYILKHNDDKNYVYTNSDFTLAREVVNDCTYILKSASVAEKVKEKTGVDYSIATIRQSITASNPDSTRFLEVSVITDDSPETSKLIVDAVCDVGAERVTQAIGFEQVSIYQYGTSDKEPYNRVGFGAFFIIAAVVAIAVYFIFLIIFLLDDRIRTAEDVEEYLGLSVLGQIPNSEDSGKDSYYSEYYSRPYKSNNAQGADSSNDVAYDNDEDKEVSEDE